LLLLHNGEVLSIQAASALLTATGFPQEHYLVYAHLRRQGYIVKRWRAPWSVSHEFSYTSSSSAWTSNSQGLGVLADPCANPYSSLPPHDDCVCEWCEAVRRGDEQVQWDWKEEQQGEEEVVHGDESGGLGAAAEKPAGDSALNEAGSIEQNTYDLEGLDQPPSKRARQEVAEAVPGGREELLQVEVDSGASTGMLGGTTEVHPVSARQVEGERKYMAETATCMGGSVQTAEEQGETLLEAWNVPGKEEGTETVKESPGVPREDGDGKAVQQDTGHELQRRASPASLLMRAEKDSSCAGDVGQQDHAADGESWLYRGWWPQVLDAQHLWLSTAAQGSAMSDNMEHTSDKKRVMCPVFDIYLPKAQFSRRRPDAVNFQLCICSSRPPVLGEIVALERAYPDMQFKFSSVSDGIVVIFGMQTCWI
ncbi:hypothetical protein CYMTET_8299, partial [Cymbomonas tetramitiformis]